MTHSQFEKLQLSPEIQASYLEDEIKIAEKLLEDAKKDMNKNWSVKQRQAALERLNVKYNKLYMNKNKDGLLYFDELGIDRLYVDEAHKFKNLETPTKIENISGLQTAHSQRSSDMLFKVNYLNDLTDYKGVVFATGTPVSNTITEMYTMQRYLQPQKLKQMDISHFDEWASTFAKPVTESEFDITGNSFKIKTRFAGFFNFPELKASFAEVADIKTADMLNLERPKYENIVIKAKPSEFQEMYMNKLDERTQDIFLKKVAPSEDNYLCITNDGRKLALDERIIDPSVEENKGSKVHLCAEEVYKNWFNSHQIKGTQMIFCDQSTPNNDDTFSVYHSIKEILIEKGIPQEQIAFIHDAGDKAEKKEALFEKVRNGEVRVIIGSTEKMGTGTNAQNKIVALHNLDCPWRPSDVVHTQVVH